jgi:hypothetical protein
MANLMNCTANYDHCENKSQALFANSSQEAYRNVIDNINFFSRKMRKELLPGHC